MKKSTGIILGAIGVGSVATYTILKLIKKNRKEVAEESLHLDDYTFDEEEFLKSVDFFRNFPDDEYEDEVPEFAIKYINLKEDISEKILPSKGQKRLNKNKEKDIILSEEVVLKAVENSQTNLDNFKK